MSTELRVRRIMDPDPLRLSPEDPIRRATALMIEHEASAAAVLDADGRLCGILTQKDCFRPAVHASYYQEWRGTVADHMTATVVAIEAGDDVVRAAEMFVDHPHRVFPVVEGGQLVGMLRRSQVLATLYRMG